MDKIKIVGGKKLQGTVSISGAKNAALPLMCTSLLTDEKLRLINIPHLADIATMAQLLLQHGVSVAIEENKSSNISAKIITLQASNINNLTASYDIMRKMRASILVLGPLLARFGKAKVSLPGGCAIGSRPVDMHLSALEKMGARIKMFDGYVEAESVNGGLQGAHIIFDKVSVGATENILMAASLARGETLIENAAQEPEITDLADCLNKMGAKITGMGTSSLRVEGVEKLHGTDHYIIPDRIEAGTFIAAAAITGGEIELINGRIDHLQAVVSKFSQLGVDVEEKNYGIKVKTRLQRLEAVDIQTAPYPDFPTDMQAQIMAVMSVALGESKIEESIFENRFMHVPELCRMGADIKINGNIATVKGVAKLKAAQVMATDLRASVSLIIAALAAEGETIINRVYHIDRGYEVIEEKLALCGADIERIH